MNNKHHSTKHLVDVLFVLALFAVFTISALILVILGAQIYQKTVDHMEENYQKRTIYTYISEKIRQSDSSDAISIQKTEASYVLCIKESYASGDYCTYIYEDEGTLKEYYTRSENEFLPSLGTDIMPVTNFCIEQANAQLLKFSYTSQQMENIIFYVSISSNSSL